MCGTNSMNQNCCCCPNATVFQETICGNLSGGTTGLTDFPVWTAPVMNDYFQGTFEIFDAGPGVINGAVTTTAGSSTPISSSAGNSTAVSVNNPQLFTVTVPPGTFGKFCIILYKRLFA